MRRPQSKSKANENDTMPSAVQSSRPRRAKRRGIDAIRNIGIVAHIDSGKTTITERMLKICGKIRTLGEVHDGAATMDFMKEEQERGITIGSAATNFAWRDCTINLIDTPGHVDFTAEVERSLRILDGAVLAIDSVAGAQAQSETVNRQMNRYGVPRLVFVNKMDRVGASFRNAVDSLTSRLGLSACPIQVPVGEGPEFRGLIDLVRMRQMSFPESSNDPAEFVDGEIDEEHRARAQEARQHLLEALSHHCDELLEILLEELEPPEDLVRQVLRDATMHHGFVPVLLGSALRNRGVPALLDSVVDYLPSPRDTGGAQGQHPVTGDVQSFDVDAGAPFGAMVFKTVHFSTGDLTFVRVYSGSMEAGKGVFNTRLGKHERVGHIYLVHAGSREPIEAATAGQIIACTGLKESATGDTLCRKDQPVVFGETTFADPVISMAIEPRSTSERDRLGEVLGLIAREDPTFRAATDPETGQTIISGMGELHLEVVVHRLHDEFRIDVITGKPRVAYRQAIRKPAKLQSRHIKQTGGSGQYAVADLEFERLEDDSVEFADKITGGKITREFLVALEKGIRDYCEAGGRRGAKIQGLRVTCVDGKMHEVDSSQVAFYNCGFQAMRQAEDTCGLELLEPIMKVVVTAPEEYLGSVLGDLNSRRGQVAEIRDEGQDKQIVASVPLSELSAYATSLRSSTSGRGNYTMEPDGYQTVPASVIRDLEG